MHSSPHRKFQKCSTRVLILPGLTFRAPDINVGMALSTALLIAVTKKAAYLSISCVDLSSRTSPKLSAASRADSNASLSVWLNFYQVGLVCEFL